MPRKPTAPDARLRPTERVRRPAVFQGVLKGGRCFRDRVARIHYRENGRELSRLGLVVSRRVGNAVIRNRIKRVFRELFRKAKARLDPPLDVVVVPDSRAGPQDRETYARVFEAFLGRLGAGAFPPGPPEGAVVMSHPEGAVALSPPSLPEGAVALSRAVLSPPGPPEGTGAVAKRRPEMRASRSFLTAWPGRAAILAARVYQKTLSPLIPVHCRFQPTCSHYFIEAVERHGFLRGVGLGLRRLARCQPLCRGGYDPVP